jgi:hypothetical protein
MAALAEPAEGVERGPRRLRRHRDHNNLNQILVFAARDPMFMVNCL